MPRKGKGSKRRPVDRLTAEQRAAMRGPTAAERATIREGRRQPYTWDEVNSTKGGGRDLGRY